MTKIKTLAAAIALTLLAGSSAFAADAMKSDGMMKKDAMMMKKCEAMGDKAMHNKTCMAMMKKHDAMKSDAMKGDAMKGDSMKGEGHH